jgi:hypothetical protein
MTALLQNGERMEPEIEDIGSEKVQNEISRLQSLEGRILWARVVTMVGAIGCSFWVIYRVFATSGFLLAFFAFLGLSIAYKFGASPMFAVAASVLCFSFNVVGIWLPITAYIVAALLLYVDLKRDNLRRRVDPFNLGSR